MKIDFTGKTVVVTGGSAGIGLAAAKLFCENGANVAICGRDTAKLEASVNELKKAGGSVIGVPCDVTSRAQLFALADKTVEAFGGIDVWVNNAGHNSMTRLMNVTEEYCDNQINLNFKSALWGSQAAFKYMQEKGGAIVNAASYAGIIPGVGMGMYGAAKTGVISLTRTLASELAPYNIRVTAYAPGPVLTPLLEESLTGTPEQNEASLARMASSLALQRVGEADEVANLILYLASDYASFITGTCVDVSGGKIATQAPANAWAGR